ncbi:3-hydroxyacyl-CoA dehydrogenase NAD-binding domain-containing protein [Methyloversatilis discipulorum]|uniref:3-hydroxyacyl-CoA dehydrogenase NAD-binding domain-containing protein n=1 Tax=Methyloversatilis discipulorum TaxID=1119528 RepID=UPI001A40BB7A|nr:3-hydroxyacyl-CoA dehydrogenase NAD-binding domain-containing protein [Methyloversatilis discipulorum]MBL8468850.1 enoyl-CoA hydratase/isomerase family protein [Methyloversatilis discipulorum]
MSVHASDLKHWRIERDEDNLVWLVFDRAGENVNTLSGEAMRELGLVLDAFDAAPPRALVILSGKTTGFIAGADIGEFGAVKDEAGARDIVGRGWNLFNRLAAVRYPTCALVRGFCVGGGTELSLACRHIVAVDEPGTRFALPEVLLGIVPGWGGMLRLPQRIGAPAALDMMLTGRALDAKRAKAAGLVDEIAPARLMREHARARVLADPPRRPLPRLQRLLLGPLRGVVAKKALEGVAKKARREHYPAPYAIVDMWRDFGGNALAVPADHPSSMAALVAHPTTPNLQRVYHLRERLRGYAKSDVGLPPVRRVHVVGAGVMGGDIAAWCALRGFHVTLQDNGLARIAPAMQRAAKAFARKFRRDRQAQRDALDRLIPDPTGAGVAGADLIIEAIYEDLDAKQALLADVERRARHDALLATNTSSLRIEDIAQALHVPGRLVGIHFFNPVAKMPLVEVVRGTDSFDQAVQRAAAFVGALDKLPLPVASAPGFLVNAVLGPYMLEAMKCVDEGVSPEVVDRAALDFGMAMGPIELVDTVGLDIAMAAGARLTGGATAPTCLQQRVDAGHLGCKSGQGFYVWKDGRPVRTGAAAVPEGLAARLVEPLIRVTRRCVEQGVVADADLADAGLIFGAGFAPYTGGPLHYHAVSAMQHQSHP